jgi:hypothetical protein
MTTAQNALPKVELSCLRSMSRVSLKMSQLRAACFGISIFTRNERQSGAEHIEQGGFVLLFLSISLPFLTQLAPKDLQAQERAKRENSPEQKMRPQVFYP